MTVDYNCPSYTPCLAGEGTCSGARSWWGGSSGACYWSSCRRTSSSGTAPVCPARSVQQERLSSSRLDIWTPGHSPGHHGTSPCRTLTLLWAGCRVACPPSTWWWWVASPPCWGQRTRTAPAPRTQGEYCHVVMSCHVMSCHVSCHVMSCHVML